MKLSEVAPTGSKNYHFLEKMLEKQKMRTLKDFSRWYNNKNGVPTLGALQKMLKIYHSKGISLRMLGFTLPNHANICLHKYTGTNFYPITESDKGLLEEIRVDMVHGPSIVFTSKTL